MPVDSTSWCTLSDVKEHLNITSSSKDTFLTNLINRAYKILEEYIGMQLYTKTYTEYYNGDDSDILVLRRKPIISVTSVHVDSLRVYGSDTLMDSGCYFVNEDVGQLEIYQATGSGPSWFASGRRNIKVIYVAGYASFPADAVETLVEYVSWLYRRAGTEGTTSQSLGGKSEVYDERSIPLWLKMKLDRYKTWFAIE